MIQHLNQTYISIKMRQNSILRLALERCVPRLSSQEKEREKMGAEAESLSFVNSPL